MHACTSFVVHSQSNIFFSCRVCSHGCGQRQESPGTVRHGRYATNALALGKKKCYEPNVNTIITDYWMPEMTGYELLKKLKESSELKQIPVVLMSSENVPTRISRCLEEGAEDFLVKPVRQSDVNRVFSRVPQ
ncbi:hypothetical protein EJB05_42466, partial [Eragrostis curvula]